MADLSLARRYAQALFDTARKDGTIERVETDLETIDALIRTQPNLPRILCAPVIARPQKKELVRRLFESRISNLTLRFLYLLIDKRREAVLPEVNRQFRALSYAAENIRGSRERRRVDELPGGTVLPNAPEHAAKVQRVVLAPDDAGVAMPCPLAVGLVRQPCIIAIIDFTLLPRPRQVVVD